MCPTVTLRREAAQTPASATSKWGLGREARAALLREEPGGLQSMGSLGVGHD